MPLTDADRAPWLAAIQYASTQLLQAGRESRRRLLGAQTILSNGPRRRHPDRLRVSQRLEVKVVLEWAA
jgi:gluconate kinase